MVGFFSEWSLINFTFQKLVGCLGCCSSSETRGPTLPAVLLDLDLFSASKGRRWKLQEDYGGILIYSTGILVYSWSRHPEAPGSFERVRKTDPSNCEFKLKRVKSCDGSKLIFSAHQPT